MKLKLTNHKKALAIVAHPDDETIWMGGTILMHPSVEWTIHCLTRSSDKDREPKFQRICRIYGARAIITDLEDEDNLSQEESVLIIKKLVIAKIKQEKFDYLFTHGSNGEYGHSHHVAAHIAVRELIKDRKLQSRKVYFFNYEKAKGKKQPSMVANRNSDYKLRLSESIFHIKKRLQAEIHGYTWNGIDNSLCTNPEAFKIYK